ncbi:MAG: hypothetical protein JNJ48_02185 [Phycisphaerae bacterium]|nr:hypothetical protein [Phycisphaerae bacterium]
MLATFAPTLAHALALASAAPLPEAQPPAPPAPKPAAPAWVLNDNDLSPIPGSRRSLGSSGVQWTGPDGQTQPLPTGRALVRAEAWGPVPRRAISPRVGLDAAERGQRSGALELTDGSRIVGALLPRPIEGELVAWVHPTLGRITLPLESVRRLALDAESARWQEPMGLPEIRGSKDAMLLTNGDKLEGFVAAVQASGAAGDAAEQPHVRIEVDGQGRLIPIERVREVRLVNPARAARTGVRAWVGEGSVISAAAAESPDGKSVSLRIEREPGKPGEWSLELDSLRALSLDAGRLAGLGSLTIEAQEPWAGRRWSPPARLWDADEADNPAPLGAPDVLLPGPMTVRWTLPDRAARVGGWLLLPEGSREWGDCVVVIRFGEREAFRQRVNGQKPTARFDLSVPAGASSLSVTVEPGEYGPIQDAIVLRRVLIASN